MLHQSVKALPVATLWVVAFLLIGGATAGAAGPAAAAPAEAPCAAPARACVDLSDQRAWLLDGRGGVLRGPVPITSGILSQPTPAGEFRVTRKAREHTSSITGTPMPYSVFFDHRGRAFHAGSLQRPSLGCIHLSDDDAAAFFDSLQIGDPVEIQP
ncbi:L,D-transpeptidase [Actinomycetospora aeridis]|uniref:L,D-transpeptidase n=1 Tax=Actinomycetospora aeridis TaxID=3129231 RepID=A0ABU8NDA7_9PSEU